MPGNKLKLTAVAGLLFLAALGCSLPYGLLATSTPVPPTPTETWPPPLASPTRPVPTPSPAGEYHGTIRIAGSPEFVEQTRLALSLLEAKAPEAYRKIQTYVGIIEQGQHSGMWVWEQPPRYEVGDATAFSSVTWYASTIAHDATHSELYHNGQEWTGVEVELFCNAYQLTVLEQIGAPRYEIEYLAGLDGDHCDLDGDGDCDWEDYENRDW